MRILIPALALLLACPGRFDSPAARSPSGVPKPTAPIEIDARLDGDAVVATAATPLDAEVEIEVVLPEGVDHRGGARSVRGRGPAVRVEAAPKDRARREILVRATVEIGGARLTRVVSLVTGDGPPPPPPGTLKVNSRGEAILEFGP